MGYTDRNTGVFAAAIFAKPDIAKGKYLQAITDILTFEELLAMWARAVGVEARVESVSLDEYAKSAQFGEASGREVGLNMVYFFRVA